ncbi:nuclease SbcCD subunit D [Tepiditoga spiralis]|uniref:Nuclease SbcCD subunit D n=1 Tax=Tepiditoga spiralis TaxID=2108365 RepID=A0A7G1G570_9BACT|nr:exonuclease subunit SbcD [Tepiditoga spiralis]BBE31255.1 nuclease SbcCD subunit D [Tepiditoga spiralis]
MKILHTADWHLGKMLEGYSRINEQREFINEFIEIVKRKNPDLIIIAGDIFDTYNPPSEAEYLFNYAIKNISEEGKRAVIIIAGNHDSPERLESIKPLANEFGVLIFGTPKSKTEYTYYKGFSVINSEESYIEILKDNEKAAIIALPYPSEKRLNEIFEKKINDKDFQKTYSERIGELFNNLSKKYFKKDTINILVSHFFVNGGSSTESERNIELGGIYTINPEHLPKNADYIALGHLHNQQKVSKHKNAFFSGSPIQYSKSESNHIKGVLFVEIQKNKKVNIEKIMLKNYKPIEIWKTNSIDEAINLCKKNSEKNVWAYLEIKTKNPLTGEEIKELKKYKKDLLEIKPIFTDILKEKTEQEFEKTYTDLELFKMYYKSINNIEPKNELVQTFLELINKVGE